MSHSGYVTCCGLIDFLLGEETCVTVSTLNPLTSLNQFYQILSFGTQKKDVQYKCYKIPILHACHAFVRQTINLITDI